MIHKKLAEGNWYRLSFFEQMSNIGSEVERAIKWKNKKNNSYCQSSFERALELIDLTIEDKRNLSRLKELTRLREIFVDYFLDNQYSSSDKMWNDYFFPFNSTLRLNT